MLTAVTFSLLGFIIGIWADGFEQFQLFFTADDHAAHLSRRHLLFDRSCCRRSGRTVALLNPIMYLVSGFRWLFFGAADVAVGISLAMTVVFLGAGLATVWWMFRTGYRLKR